MAEITLTSIGVGSTLSSSTVDNNFTTIANEMNGNLDGDNIASEGVEFANVSPFDKARVTRSGAQTINTASTTAIAFDSEDYDVGGLHSTASNTSRVTVLKAAKYDLKGNIRWGTESATGYVGAILRVNGTTIIDYDFRAAATAYNSTNKVATDYSLAIGDYVEMLAEQNSGGDKTITVAGTHFEVSLKP